MRERVQEHRYGLMRIIAAIMAADDVGAETPVFVICVALRGKVVVHPHQVEEVCRPQVGAGEDLDCGPEVEF